MTAERKPHPDFVATPAESQWTGPLPALFETLKHEAYKLQGEEAWRILPGGALVSMRINAETFKKQLRFARRLRKAFNDKGAAAWHTELRVFLEQFGCKTWIGKSDSLIEPTQEGESFKLEAVFEEPNPLGAKPNVLICHRCKEEFAPTPNDRIYEIATCNKCAMQSGVEFTEGKKKERAGGQVP
jgi:hypothetical protein